MKRTKIIATIGPASSSAEMLTALTKAGMNVCRLNFSHGTHENFAECIQTIRDVRERTGEPLTILQDLQGPKIRVGEMPKSGVILKDGAEIIFTTGKSQPPKKIGIDQPDLHTHVRAGEHFLLDDGLMDVEVIKIKGREIVCRVIHGGTLLSHKGVNLPQTKLALSSLTEKDLEDVRFGVEQGVDWMALSFVRSAEDIQELRTAIAKEEKRLKITLEPPIRIMAKIEKQEALDCLDEIVAAADGVLIARGDLGIEIPFQKVPLAQKRILKACLEAAKPVAVATQMLDSMIRNPRPTRAEVSDVINAVVEHTDATTLSGETTTGKYPLESVKAMAAAIHEAEASVYDNVPIHVRLKKNPEEALTNIASVLAKASCAKAILVASMSGNAARFVSRYRPEIPIFTVTPFERVVYQLNLSWGVQPFFVPLCETIPELIARALEHLLREKKVRSGDEIVVVAGEPLGESGSVNLVELRTV